MNAADFKSSGIEAPARNGPGKYITLVVLLLWVVAVFAFTLFKFSGGAK